MTSSLRSLSSLFLPAFFTLLALVTAPASSTEASPVKFWSSASARDFLAGEAKGTAVSAEGRVRLGLDLAPRAWPEEAAEAMVLAAASGKDGRVWVATGGGQGRLFVAAPGKPPVLVFTAKEPHLTAVAVAPDGTVVCASSPNGVVYRVDPAAKDPEAAGTPWGDPKEAAIWSLAFGPDGTLYAGTGSKGRVYRRGKDGAMSLVHEVEDSIVRALAVGPDGTLYLGTSERGLVVAVSPSGTARTLYNFSRPEVSGLALRPDGALFAVGTSAPASLPPATPDSRSRPGVGPSASASPPAASREEVPKGSVSVSTAISASRPSGTPPPPAGAGADVVLVRRDGVVEPAWSFPEDTAYSLRWDAAREALLVSTGPRGRLYSLKERRLELLAQVDEKQVVAALDGGGEVTLVTAGAPGLRRAASAAPRSGLFVSAVKDVVRVSTPGRIRWDGDAPAGSSVRLFLRGGNSLKPDGTWSAWVPVGTGPIPPGSAGAGAGSAVPASRFFQWKAELTASPSGVSPVLERVELAWSESNLRPVLENVAVLEPGAVYARAAASSGPAVLSVTNPDENGIFAGLEAPRDAGPDGGGKKLFRKGFRTVTWKGTDPNGDSLRYDVEIRRDGTGPTSATSTSATSASSPWLPLRKDLEEGWVAFDTTSLPDGRYRFRVTASDRAVHPESEALSTTEESELFTVDNTPPVLKVEARRVEGDELVVVFSVEDSLSPIARAEGAVNADRWRFLAPEDGLADSPRERFVLRVPKPSGAALLSLRAVDAAGNVATGTVEWPEAFR